VSGLVEETKLRDLVTAKLAELEGVKNLRPVLDMDLLWLDGNEVVRAFEAECTTTMTSALQRGSESQALFDLGLSPEKAATGAASASL
jgi:hypothetical protein